MSSEHNRPDHPAGPRRLPFRPPARPGPWRAVLCAAMGAVLVALLLAGAKPVVAAPVRTVLHGPDMPAQTRFLADLAQLWRWRNAPTPERLATRELDAAELRMQALARERGDFALVDAATAAERLTAYPELAAVAVLWPEAVHAVTRNPAVNQVTLPPPAEYWVLESSRFIHDALRAEGMPREGRNAISLVPDAVLTDALNFAEAPVVLVADAPPVQALSEALGAQPDLRLLAFDPALLEELELNAPWLIPYTLDGGTYPGQGSPVEVPALYQVLVGRRDLPDATVEKMLDTAYDKARGAAVQNPLFAHLDSRLNAVFSKLFPFHTATARRFDFTPSLP